MQRLLRPQFDIEGRTKIEELEKYIKDVIQQGKKVVSSCVLIVDPSHSGQDSGYHKFCEEFVKDRRAGISNITKTASVCVYTIPPLLKKNLTILSTFPDEDPSISVLYGVIIAKDLEMSKKIVAVPSIAPVAQHTVSTNQAIPSSQGTSGGLHDKYVVSCMTFLNLFIILDSLQTKSGIAAQQKDLPDNTIKPLPALSVLPSAKSAIPSLLSKSNNAFSSLSSSISKLPPALIPTVATTSIGLKSSGQLQPNSDDKNKMLKVAKVCVAQANGLQTLREKQNSRSIMPFIYEDDSGYAEFSKILIECSSSKN